MQEALLLPAHPVPFGFGFGPRPVGFFPDPRLCSPNGDALFFYGGHAPFILPSPTPSPRCTPFILPSPTPPPRATPFIPSPFSPSPLGPRFTQSPRPSPRCAFFTPSPRASPRGTPSSTSASRVDDASPTEHRLRLARLALQYQDAANRYELCLSHLADAAREAAALRLENAELRVANNDLAGRFAMLGGNQASAVALAEQLRGVHLGRMHAQVQAVPVASTSPSEKHAVMPKSISIRSTGYLKMTRGRKHRVTKPIDIGAQRVFVGVDVDGAKAEEHQGGDGKKGGQVVKSAAGLEFEVYSQGMYKTELCNKWEETGVCPYNDLCQFAHGIAELRPIIRHPRYKTQVCRMILGGALCPYGHRCHFRHSIAPFDHLPPPLP